MLRELAQALDELPEKRLAADSLVTESGDYCTLGALGRHRGLDMTSVDAEDREAVAKIFGISEALAAEVMYINDESVNHNYHYLNFEVIGPMRPFETHTQLRRVQNEKSAMQRWQYMRKWVTENINKNDKHI